jgi:hypothetical protein
MTLPTHNAILFDSKAAHQAALYDACLLIVNTYYQTDMLDFYDTTDVTPYTFMNFARSVINQIAEGN